MTDERYHKIDAARAQTFWVYCQAFNEAVRRFPKAKRKRPINPLLVVRPPGFREYTILSLADQIADAARIEREEAEREVGP